MWFATSLGATQWKDNQFITYTSQSGLVSNEVFDIDQASDGSIWMATIAGASHYTPATNTWYNYTTDDGLLDDFVSGIRVTPNGSVWFFYGGNFSQMIKPVSGGETVRWIHYSKYDPNTTRVPLGYIKTVEVAPDGTYWFGHLLV